MLQEYERTYRGPYKLTAIRTFLITFIPLFAGLMIMITLIYRAEVSADKRIIKLEEEIITREAHERILIFLESISSDILFLAERARFRRYLENPDQTNADILAETFLSFAHYRKMYEQVRYIDRDGRERIRVNYIGGHLRRVAGDALQDKSHRYYYREALKLEPREVYVSPFDLNSENGALTPDSSPTIRFVTPVLDNANRTRGIFVLNFLGEVLINHLRDMSYGSNRNILLVNKKGYYMKGFSRDEEWGFLFEDRSDMTIAKQFPGEWEKIRTNDSLFESDNGLFCSRKVTPLREVAAFRNNVQPDDDLEWYIISHTSHETLMTNPRSLLFRLSLLSLFLTTLIAASSVMFARASSRRRAALDTLEEAAHRDPLTGLPNRREFIAQFEHEQSRFSRNNRPFSVLLADIDHFKQINDIWGHNCGDMILRSISELFETTLRRQDIPARWGGEEFIILLPETTLKNAMDAAEKLRTGIAGTPFVYNDRTVHVTISIGIAEYNGEFNIDSMVKAADDALYTAKSRGRNRIVTAGGVHG